MKYVIGNNAKSLQVMEKTAEDGIIPLIEAYLSMQDEPVSKEKLEEITGKSEIELRKGLDILKTQLKKNNRGMMLCEGQGTVHIAPKTRYKKIISDYHKKDYEKIIEVLDEYFYVMDNRGRSEKTIKNYKYNLRNFFKKINKPVQNINQSDIRKFLRGEKKNGNQNSTIKNKISVLKSFFGWLEIEEIVEKNPMRKIKKPKTHKKPPKYLTKEEIEKIREVNTKLIDRVILEVLYSSGLRVSELVNLDWDDIDFAEKSIYVRKGKGEKDRITFLSVKAIMLLKKYRTTREDNKPWVIQSNYKLRMSRFSIRRHVKNMGKRANLNKNISPHSLRHSFGTHLTNKGMPREMIQQLMGHEDPKTTDIYAKINMNDIKYNYRQKF